MERQTKQMHNCIYTRRRRGTMKSRTLHDAGAAFVALVRVRYAYPLYYPRIALGSVLIIVTRRREPRIPRTNT